MQVANYWRTFVGRCRTFRRRVDNCTSLLAIHDYQCSVLILQVLAGVVGLATHLLVRVVNERVPAKQTITLSIQYSSHFGGRVLEAALFRYVTS